jgi:ATP-dependent Lon protease
MNECTYIFKRGKNKGQKCSMVSCKLHLQEEEGLIKKIVNNELWVPSVIKQKILDLNTDTDNKTVIMKHYQNLLKLDTSTSEYYKNKLFVEYALSVPWNNYYSIHERIKDESIKTFIDNIRTQFDKHIYGMENVKNEVINYVCKFISNPFSQKNNIALYGSAGVCKTKFIKILSDVLKLPVKILSLGGAKDSSYFLGHNFTYVESTHGMIIQSIIDSKVMNPILYFDELDKISVSDTGKDIYSVLSNLTDPTVNSTFTDHYFRGINFDLSKVFYVFTFNDISKIDKVLLDRLNVIYVETPNKKERATILENFCLPEIINNIGIKSKITFDKECFEKLVNHTDKTIDIKVSSGIRESIRILEKILLEMNKEILCETIMSNDVIHVNYESFNKYFNKMKSQFFMEADVSIAPCHMYI